MTVKRDFFGTELAVGDTVAFVAPGYRHLAKGKIVKFTEKMVFITYKNTWNFGDQDPGSDIKQTPEQLIKA